MLEHGAFFSARLRLDADLYRPDGSADGLLRPGIVSCSGYQGLKDIHPARFARTLIPHGYVCLAFDYRGFGASDGERGRVVPQDQVEDTHEAISYLASRPGVDPGRIGLIGWGMGGGIAVQVAARDDRIKALAVCNGIASGERSTRHNHDEASWTELLALIAADRARRIEGGASERVHPFTILPLPQVTRSYVDSDLYPVAGFGALPVSLESAEAMLRFLPEAYAPLLAGRPTRIVHGANNDLYDPEEARRLAAAIGDSADLVWLEGAGHTEFMRDEHPTFLRLRDVLVEFFGRHLGGASS